MWESVEKRVRLVWGSGGEVLGERGKRCRVSVEGVGRGVEKYVGSPPHSHTSTHPNTPSPTSTPFYTHRIHFSTPPHIKCRATY